MRSTRGNELHTVTVWIDERDLPVRFDMDTSPTGAWPLGAVSFTDWGTPVEIKAPTADQIGELPN